MKKQDIVYFYNKGPYKAVRSALTGKWAVVDTDYPWRQREYRFHTEAAARKRAAEINWCVCVHCSTSSG